MKPVAHMDPICLAIAPLKWRHAVVWDSLSKIVGRRLRQASEVHRGRPSVLPKLEQQQPGFNGILNTGLKKSVTGLEPDSDGTAIQREEPSELGVAVPAPKVAARDWRPGDSAQILPVPRPPRHIRGRRAEAE